MTLEELIATLTTAQEQSTEGEWTVENRHLVDRSQPSIRSVGLVETDEQAQAIAIRHRTAGQVLEALKRLDEAESKARVCREDADINAERAEKAEAQLDRANATIKLLRRPHTDTMASVDETCRAALGDRMDPDVADALVDAVSEFVLSHVNASAYYREQLDRATKPPEFEGTIDEGAEHFGVVEFPGGRRRGDVISDHATEPLAVAELEALLEKANERIAELQSIEDAANMVLRGDKHRPMSEAPRDGSRVYLIYIASPVSGGWDTYPSAIGWLPLSEDPTS